MRKIFFQSTRATLRSLTDIFDFVWPTATAMWNLRWNVRGFLEISPKTDEKTLAGRFIVGSGIKGVNLRRSCISQTWEQQQERFAEILLISLLAMYESWCEEMAETIQSTEIKATRLQYPTQRNIQGEITGGVGHVLELIAHHESKLMIDTIYPNLISHPKFSLPYIENYLAYYRYFKEIRNCVVHRGGIADQRCLEALNALPKIENSTAIGLKEFPQHSSVRLNHRVYLSLRGVVGFSDVLLRLLVTLDAQFARHKKAEQLLLEKLKDAKVEVRLLPTDSIERQRALQKLVRKLGWEPTNNTLELELVLASQNPVS
jgi:hypothetical protein